MKDFLDQFREGPFTAIMRWENLPALWDRIRENPSGWFIYAVGETPPESPASEEELERFLKEVDALLHREHEEDYCGIVYADEPSQPSFIKIYDPNNLGVVCGFSDAPPLPGWTLSRSKPVDLPGSMPPPGNRSRWWQRIFRR